MYGFVTGNVGAASLIYQSCPDAYVRVPPDLGDYGSSPPVLRIAKERQARGEIPAGEITTVLRVR